jgi:hypothetical protein
MKTSFVCLFLFSFITFGEVILAENIKNGRIVTLNLTLNQPQEINYVVESVKEDIILRFLGIQEDDERFQLNITNPRNALKSFSKLDIKTPIYIHKSDVLTGSYTFKFQYVKSDSKEQMATILFLLNEDKSNIYLPSNEVFPIYFSNNELHVQNFTFEISSGLPKHVFEMTATEKAPDCSFILYSDDSTVEEQKQFDVLLFLNKM